jgi:hypothetical protein
VRTEHERIPAGSYTLRPWESADVAWLHDVGQEPGVAVAARFPQPFSARDAIALLRRSRQGRLDGTEFLFAIVRTDSEELLGGAELDTRTRHLRVWLAWSADEPDVAAGARRALEGWASERLGLACGD